MEKLTTKQALYEQKSLYVMALYFILTFYYFGITLMTRMVIYPSFEKVHENYQNYMMIYSALNRTLLPYSPTLLLLSNIALLWFRLKEVSRAMVWISIALCFIAVMVAPNVIGPILNTLNSNFSTTAYQQLVDLTLYLQVIPTVIVVIIAFWSLNSILKNTKPFSRWTFIILFSFAFFTAGTGAIEGLVNYNLWFTVGKNDWLHYRNSGSALAFWTTFLIPAYLPMFALIAMFWRRPKAVPKIFVTVYAITYVWMVFITFYYFIPNIQLVLNQRYDAKLFQDLLKYDGLLRGLPSLPMVVLPVWMFIKIGQQKINDKIN